MRNFRFQRTEIDDVVIAYPFIAEDDRGYFMKGYEREIFKKNGIDMEVFEVLQTHSKKGVLRGLHFQEENPQGKLVRVISGMIFDVAVDIRKGSETFGKWVGLMLDSQKHNMLYVPAGFAHGYLVVSDTALVDYKCSGPYLPEFDTGIMWNDVDLEIDWPIHLVEYVILSRKDSKLPSLRQHMEKQGG